jgi:hypothetical protein
MKGLQQKLHEAKTLLETGRLPEASRILDVMLGAMPDNPSILYLRAAALQSVGDKFNGISIALLEKAVSVASDYAAAWINLGCAYREENKMREAACCWERAIALAGEDADVCANMASLHADCGRPAEAMRWIEKALALNPGQPDANWSRALALLTRRDWDEAWTAHEWRLGRRGHHARQLADAPRWDGRRLEGLLCITGEQGIGDEIMFASCVPDAMALASHVVIECTPRLVPIFGRSFGVPCFETEEKVLAAGFKPDAQIPLGSLPMHFRRHGVDFPGSPYLAPDPQRAARWAERMGALGPRPWIGLSWLGGTKATRVHERSLDPALYAPLMGAHTCVSLQYGGELAAADAARVGLTHWPEAAGDQEYEETLALVSVLDAVVTVSTAIFHAAGSLGIPTHILVSTTPTWVHGDGGVYMPWYRSVTQWRQEKAKDWAPVVARVHEHLLQQIAHRRAAE